MSNIGLLEILGLIFVVLKLTGYINWSWWFVTMPFWISIVILAIIYFGGYVSSLTYKGKK
jgi:hypothetical protein